jgi:hypothetical protein
MTCELTIPKLYFIIFSEANYPQLQQKRGVFMLADIREAQAIITRFNLNQQEQIDFLKFVIVSFDYPPKTVTGAFCSEINVTPDLTRAIEFFEKMLA